MAKLRVQASALNSQPEADRLLAQIPDNSNIDMLDVRICGFCNWVSLTLAGTEMSSTNYAKADVQRVVDWFRKEA